MFKWLARGAWVLFVCGGVVAGVGGIETLSRAPQTARSASPPSQAVATPAPAEAPPSAPTPEPARAALRAPDDTPPPFDAAAPAALPTEQTVSPSGRLNVLLLGIDQRPDETVPGGDPGRTDSMILVCIDFDAHVASMVSIPRDGFVVIPGHGSDRVNAAYTYGELEQRGTGPDLAKRTIASLFGVPVDRYALVDVHSMEEIIDTLGGVTLEVPNRLVDNAYPTDDYRTIVVDIPAGEQKMDGVTAVEYARMRHPDSDYGRQDRQKQLLVALRNAAMRIDTLPKLPQLMPQVQHLVRTDLSPSELAQLLKFGRDLAPPREIVTLPADPRLTPAYTGPGGAAYINLTPTFRNAVKEFMDHPLIAAERAEIEIHNAGAPPGSGSRAADMLGRTGLVVNRVSTADPVTATRIEAGSNARETALAVARALGLGSDALVTVGDSAKVDVLLGADTRFPTA